VRRMRVEEKRRTGVGIADDEAIVVDGDGGDADDDDGRVWWWIICGVVAGWWWWMVLVHGRTCIGFRREKAWAVDRENVAAGFLALFASHAVTITVQVESRLQIPLLAAFLVRYFME